MNLLVKQKFWAPLRLLWRWLRPPIGLVAATLGGWVAIASTQTPGDPSPTIRLALAAGAVFAAARLAPRPLNLLVPAGIVGAAGAIAASDPADTFGAGPLRGLFGYSNAKGQLFALAALAALLIVVGVRSWTLRTLALGAAGGLVAVPILSRSFAAAGLALAFGLIAVVSPRGTGSRVAAGLMLVAFLGALGGTWAVGAGTVRTPSALERPIGERRFALWHDAVELSSREPLTGVGAGRFPVESPTAASDRDTRWAHNGFLEMAAENGIPGAVVLAAIFIWAMASAMGPGADRTTAVGAAIVATLGIHSTIDYVLHYPWVVIAAAALAGSALGPRSSLARFAGQGETAHPIEAN